MDIDGASAQVAYYQDCDPEDKPMFVENFGGAAAAGGSGSK